MSPVDNETPVIPIKPRVRRRRRSGGPRTPQGKAISARNATKHGIWSRNPTALGESQQEWLSFLQSTRTQFGAVGAYEEELVHAISVDWWALRRVRRAMTAFTTAGYEVQAVLDDAEDDLFRSARLGLPPQADMEHLLRYQTSLERAVERKVKMLEKAQSARSDGVPALLHHELPRDN